MLRGVAISLNKKKKKTAVPLGNVSEDPLQNGFWSKFEL